MFPQINHVLKIDPHQVRVESVLKNYFQGNFEEGDVVSVCDADEREFARGIIKISSQDLHSHTIPEDDVIHCNDLVIL